jgi:uncharacterized protein
VITVIEEPPATARSLRASSYTIYIDLPDDRSSVLLVHGYTGAFDKVTRSIAGYLRSRETGKVHKPLYGDWEPEEISFKSAEEPDAKTIATLQKRGFLTARTASEEEAFFTAHIQKRHAITQRLAPSYIIMPTYSCNLRCDYCFQDHMRTDPRYSHLLRIMQPDVADRIIASMQYLEKDRHDLYDPSVPRDITFFGGEPLLAQTRPAIEYFMVKARSIGPAKFGAISNGTQLDAYRDLLGPNDISWIQITLDGPAEDHDLRRIHEDGSGSFALIERNIDMALELGVRIAVRINVDRSNFERLPSLSRLFESRGWSQHSGFSAYAARVVSHDMGVAGDRALHFNSWELNRALAERSVTEPSLRSIATNDDGVRARARAVFAGRGDITTRMSESFCSAQDRMYVMDPFGDIYACWERTGDQNIRIGYIDEKGEPHLNRTADAWRERTVASNPTCRQCRFALMCGGGCAVLAEAVSGTMNANFCDAFGKRFRTTVAEAYLEHKANGPTAATAEYLDVANRALVK